MRYTAARRRARIPSIRHLEGPGVVLISLSGKSIGPPTHTNIYRNYHAYAPVKRTTNAKRAKGGLLFIRNRQRAIYQRGIGETIHTTRLSGKNDECGKL